MIDRPSACMHSRTHALISPTHRIAAAAAAAGMIAWHAKMKTPEYPQGRELVIIANDVTFQSGSFGVKEDDFFRVRLLCLFFLGGGCCVVYCTDTPGPGFPSSSHHRHNIAVHPPPPPPPPGRLGVRAPARAAAHLPLVQLGRAHRAGGRPEGEVQDRVERPGQPVGGLQVPLPLGGRLRGAQARHRQRGAGGGAGREALRPLRHHRPGAHGSHSVIVHSFPRLPESRALPCPSMDVPLSVYLTNLVVPSTPHINQSGARHRRGEPPRVRHDRRRDLARLRRDLHALLRHRCVALLFVVFVSA